MRYYSRDETEFGSFGDRHVSEPLTALPTFGGLFDSIFKPVKKKVATKLEGKGATKSQVATYNKTASSVKPQAKGLASVALAPVKASVMPKLTTSLRTQGATPAQIALISKTAAKAQPTLSDLARGFGRSAATMAPVAAPVLAPAVAAAAAPAVRAVAPTVKAGVKLAAPTVKAAVKLGGSVLPNVKLPSSVAPKPAPTPLVVAPVVAPVVPMRSTPIAVQRDLPIARSFSPAPAAAARAVKYLVLDSGQVLSGTNAQQRVPGFAVWSDGQVVRQ